MSATTSNQTFQIDLPQERLPQSLAPPGFSGRATRGAAGAGSSTPIAAKSSDSLKAEKAWALAKSPASQVMMQLFMMWMSGSSVSIFSIMIVFFMLMNPVKAIFAVSAAFAPYEVPGRSLLYQKLVYVGINALVSGFGVYKLWGMGLLPATDADWVHSLPVKLPMETSIGVAR